MNAQPVITTIVGPESSGKTTLARAMAAELGCPWVSEYARDFLHLHGPGYAEADLVSIAEGQYHAVTNALKNVQDDGLPAQKGSAGRVIVDSGLLSVVVWAELKFGRVDPRIQALFEKDPTHAYILLRPVIPWTPDPLRESPSLLARAWIYNHYLRHLQVLGRPFRIR